jgi:hypothetical protein
VFLSVSLKEKPKSRKRKRTLMWQMPINGEKEKDREPTLFLLCTYLNFSKERLKKIKLWNEVTIVYTG